MQIKWQVEITPNSRGTEPSNHNSAFVLHENRLYHTYKVINTIVVLDFDIDSGKFRTRYISLKTNNGKVFAKEIKYYVNGDDLLLYTSNNIYNIGRSRIKKLSKSSIEPIEHISCGKRKYKFENLMVHFPSPRTIECMDCNTKQRLWKHALKGYPYTAVENIDNHLFFGTAGKGGALYCIELKSGDVKRDYSTKGTSNYCWYKNSIITYTDIGHLQQLDPYSNHQIELLELSTKIGEGVPMIIVNNCLYTISFSRKNKDIWPKPTYLTCISLLEDNN